MVGTIRIAMMNNTEFKRNLVFQVLSQDLLKFTPYSYMTEESKDCQVATMFLIQSMLSNIVFTSEWV